MVIEGRNIEKKRKGIIKIGENEKELIKIIGLGLLTVGIVATAVAFPGLPMALKPFLKRGQKNFKKEVKKLKKKGVIYLGPDEIHLTKRGKELLKLIEISEIKIEPPKKWDKLWRLVSYDVPKTKNKERDWFRHQLTNLDFTNIQDSLWAFPYDCEQEISVIAQTLGISPHVVLMQAKTIPDEKKILKRYSLN